MNLEETFEKVSRKYVRKGDHSSSDYFGLIKELLEIRDLDRKRVNGFMTSVYELIEDEIKTNAKSPVSAVTFGTSGWRGILGKDIFVKSVKSVAAAIIQLYQEIDKIPDMKKHLGVDSIEDAQQRGCLVGFDNRFGGEILGRALTQYLSSRGFKVYYCGETTTGVMSAALLMLNASFSVNLTPSHNPLEYGGFKYNAADAGPAAAELTTLITRFAREIIKTGVIPQSDETVTEGMVEDIDSLGLWQDFVIKNESLHGVKYFELMQQAASRDIALVVDSVHGASRLHIARLLGEASKNLTLLRGEVDVSFGGIAPEPSSKNMRGVTELLKNIGTELKLGAIIDPDGDRIRFTDGTTEISMNQFGALAYYFIHETKGKKGMVAKTVATSNMANSVAEGLGEEVFEPRVGFKEFKPVIGKALVLFEESDGISIIGHTPEKDAYIGLLLAIDMTLTTGKNLGELKDELEKRFGAFCPDRDGVVVNLKGDDLLTALQGLEKYDIGSSVSVGGKNLVIKKVITIDGRKMIFEDDSWLMIRPSGTEPKVRFYVESRSPEGTGELVDAARSMLMEIGVL